MEFESSKAFAYHIKAREHEYAAEAEDIEERMEVLKNVYSKEIQEAGIEFPKNFTPVETMYQDVVKSLVREFYDTLPKAVKTQFSKRFYFSTIDNRYPRASIRRSNNGKFYAVFINSNLITGFHRLGKLEISMFFPEAVHYCSRFPGQEVSRRQMIEVYAEVAAHFSETKIALGPLVILKEPYKTAHAFSLTLQEQLIIFHEIGHFLNGDLEPNQENREVFDNFPNASHQRESLADIIGFGLLIRQLQSKEELTREMRYIILLAVINLYKVQYLLQGIETEDYPHPLDRMGTVINKFYGPAIEEWVGEAIMKGDTGPLTLENMPVIALDEKEILEYIEQRLEKAFEEPVTP